MKKECIRVYYKRPGKNLIEVKIPNELDWLHGAVEGYIEAVTLKVYENGMPNLVMLCNEEGKLKDMQHNFSISINGVLDDIVGPVLFVGSDGEEFTDCPLNRKQMDAFMTLREIEGRARQ